MRDLIDRLIRSFNGYMYETAGVIAGFFDDPGQAQQCARELASLLDKNIEVCGNYLTVPM